MMDGEGKNIYIVCTTPNCVDKDDCDGEIIKEIKDVHFEPLPSIKERHRAICNSLTK